MSGIEIWLKGNISWLGFVMMTTIGSVVAHIKAFEASDIEWTYSKHIWGIITRVIYGVFAGLIVYFAHGYFGWDEKLSFIATGLCCVFATDVVDFWYKLGKKWFQKVVGVEVEK